MAMIHIEKYIISLFTMIFLCSCSNQSINKVDSEGYGWDFDHQLQYRQTRLGERLHRLEILNNDNVNFSQMSVFLVRHSYGICGHYGFKIEIIQGIEKFTDTIVKRNYILRSLLANVEC